jgi:hypothetical protein
MSQAKINLTISYDTKPIDLFRLLRYLDEHKAIEDMEFVVD